MWILSPLCSYYDNLDNWLEGSTLCLEPGSGVRCHAVHTAMSLTPLQLCQLKHEPVAVAMLYGTEMGHAHAVLAVPIERRSRAAG